MANNSSRQSKLVTPRTGLCNSYAILLPLDTDLKTESSSVGAERLTFAYYIFQTLVSLSLTSAPFSYLQQLSSRRVLPRHLLLVVNPAFIVVRQTLAHPRSEDNKTSSAMTSDPIVACGCGRTFLSKVALEQHRRDKAISVSSSTAPNLCGSLEVSRAPDSAHTGSPKARRLLFLNPRPWFHYLGSLISNFWY